MADEIRIKLTAEGNAKVEIDKVEKELKDLQKSAKATTKNFNKTEKALEETAKDAKRVTVEVKKSSTSFLKLAGAVAGGTLAVKALGAGFRLAGRAIRGFVDFSSEAIEASEIQQDAVNRLNQALAQSGQFTEEASQSLQEYASALQAQTKFGDEAILNAQALLQSLGQLDQEGLKAATKTSLDLAAALGVSLETAVTLVGKAAAGEIGTFSRYGVIIQKGATNAETLTNALTALNKQFGGAAAAQVQTFSGAVAQANNVLGDLKEEVGAVVTENTIINDVIKESTKAFVEIQATFKENRDLLKELAADGVIVLANSFIFLFKSVLSFLRVGRELSNSLKLLSGDVSAAKLAVIQKRIAFFEARNETGKYTKQINLLTAELIKQREKVINFNKDNKDTEEVFKQLEQSADRLQKRINELNKEQDPDAINKRNEALRKQSDLNKKNADSTRELTAEQKKQNEAAKALTVELGTDGTEENRLKAESALLEEERAAQLITEEQFLLDKEALLRESQALEEERLRTAAQTNQEIAENLDDSIAASKERLQVRIAKLDAQRTANEEKEAQRRTAAQREALAGIATLQSSNNKTLFNIGKAAALAQATIDGIASIQKTAAAFPFPINIPFVAAATAAQAANIAKIASAKPPALQGGIDSVPPGFDNDTFPALLSSGERVVPAKTNQDLTAFLQGQRNTDALLVELIGAVKSGGNVMVQIGSEDVAATVRRELESGGTLEVEA